MRDFVKANSCKWILMRHEKIKKRRLSNNLEPVFIFKEEAELENQSWYSLGSVCLCCELQEMTNFLRFISRNFSFKKQARNGVGNFSQSSFAAYKLGVFLDT